MVFEIQAHGASSRLALRSLRAARPSVLVVPHAESVFPLAEALDLAGDTPVVVEASAVEPRAFAQALAPFLPRVSLRSFDERILAEARRLHPNLETTLLFDQPLRLATAAGTIGPRRDLVTRELVEAAHSVGLRIVPWTVDDPCEMLELIDLGVDGLVTARPTLLRTLVSPRAAAA